MSRNSLPLTLPGKMGRKTGLVIGDTVKDSNGIDQLEHFYLSSDEENDKVSSQNIETNNIKKLNERMSKRSELERLIYGENSTNEDANSKDNDNSLKDNEKDEEDSASSSAGSSDGEESVEREEDIFQSDEIKSAEDLGGPIKINNDIMKQLASSSKLTKNIALNNKKKNKKVFNDQLVTNEKVLVEAEMIISSSFEEEEDEKDQEGEEKKEEEEKEGEQEEGEDEITSKIEKPNAIKPITYPKIDSPSKSNASPKKSQPTSKRIDSSSVSSSKPLSEPPSEASSDVEIVEEEPVVIEEEVGEEEEEPMVIEEEEREEGEEEEGEEGEEEKKEEEGEEGEEEKEEEEEEEEEDDDDVQIDTNKPIVTTLTPSRESRLKTQSQLKKLSTPTKKTLPKAPNTPQLTLKASPSKVSKTVTPKPKSKTKSNLVVEPIRKSSRHRIPPVKSWANEKAIYKVEQINGVRVKSLVDVKESQISKTITHIQRSQPSKTIEKKKIDKSPKKGQKRTIVEAKEKSTPPLKQKKLKVDPKNPKTKSDSKSPKTFKKPNPEAITEVPSSDNIDTTIKLPKKRTKLNQAMQVSKDPSAWKSHESISIPVFEGPGGSQVNRTVAYTSHASKATHIISTHEENFRINTLFDNDGEFCGGGIIEICPNNRKATKANNDTYFIFHVIEGSVNVNINSITFNVDKGCTFEIPMGNYYELVNVGTDTARMLFVQARYVVIGESSDEESSAEDED